MNDQENKNEFIRLAATLEQINNQLAISEEICNIKQSELKNTLLNYWEHFGGNVGDEAQIIEMANCQRALSAITYSTPLKLQKMLNSPYFGRIDFAEQPARYEFNAEQIYVGISSLTNKENGEFLVYDWRAPISEMFYDFGLGKAWYNCAEGTINGTITLKRQYKITNGCMEYMFDADLKIDDEILQEILGKSADDKMHTIVNSIQREQNHIIRDTSHRAVFAEGPAGSGKTSVALHRIAFLLYQDRDILHARNVLILSPNHLFSDYISNVLPEIGEENVLQMTFQDYVSRSINELPVMLENRSSHLERMLSNKFANEYAIRVANIRFKSSRFFEQAIQEYLDWIQTRLVDNYPDIEFRGQIIFKKEEWLHYYLASFSCMPATIRLQKIRKLIQVRMRPLVHAVRKEKEAKIIASAEEVNEKTIKALARICAKKEFDHFIEKIEQLTNLNPLSEYKMFFEDPRVPLNLPSSITTFQQQWPSIQKQTLDYINNGILPYEDTPAFLYFQGVLQGFPINRDIRHLVIDEAQDYTTLQLKILTNLFPNATWTVVGDSAQSIHPFLNTATFENMREIIGIDNSLMFRLTRSYRSTKQIQAFCQALLPYKTEVTPVNRLGPLPSITRIEKMTDLDTALVQTIRAILKEGWQSIGVITKNAAEAISVFSDLKSHIKLNLITEEDDEFQRGVVVIPSYLAKGLEFDAVLVVNANDDNYGQDEDCHILYIVCTRALHRLCLYYNGIMSPFLVEMSKHLYQLN